MVQMKQQAAKSKAAPTMEPANSKPMRSSTKLGNSKAPSKHETQATENHN